MMNKRVADKFTDLGWTVDVDANTMTPSEEAFRQIQDYAERTALELAINGHATIDLSVLDLLSLE